MRSDRRIKVQGSIITVADDYISLSDMVSKAAEEAASKPQELVAMWLNNVKVLEFLYVWEKTVNEYFKETAAKELIEKVKREESITIKEWIENTEAKGIYIRRSGENAGVYGHRDVAVKFGATISIEFEVYLIKEFNRLKEQESSITNLNFLLYRALSKDQYAVQTDAVKKYKIPNHNIPEERYYIAYAEEGDILNRALFGFSAREWRERYPDLATKRFNVRDFSSPNELKLLSSLESRNAEMLQQNIGYPERLRTLVAIVDSQLPVLNEKFPEGRLRKDTNGVFHLPTPGQVDIFFPQRAISKTG